MFEKEKTEKRKVFGREGWGFVRIKKVVDKVRREEHRQEEEVEYQAGLDLTFYIDLEDDGLQHRSP